jgi:hypothetical protein
MSDLDELLKQWKDNPHGLIDYLEDSAVEGLYSVKDEDDCVERNVAHSSICLLAKLCRRFQDKIRRI